MPSERGQFSEHLQDLWVHHTLGRKLAGWPGPESGSQQSYIQLAACTSGVFQGPVPGPVLLSTLNNLDEGTE